MSRNDQLLVKEHDGKFYVFDVMAESWADIDDQSNTNVLYTSEAKAVADTREEAHKLAHKIDADDEFYGSEYGVVDEILFKDGAAVTVVTSSN